MSAPVVISGQASSFPPSFGQEELWAGYFAERFPGRVAARAFRAAGVKRRHAAVNPLIEDVADWPTSARMARFSAEAMPLAKEAVAKALEAAELAPEEIGLLVVASCTGYTTPGIDVGLARDFHMAPTLRRLLVGHVGCHAALPALEAAQHFVIATGRPAVVLCLELPSLHLRPSPADVEQAVVHALFSDGAAALVVAPEARRGLELLATAARSNTANASYLGWEVGDHGFEMTLSPRLPAVVAAEVGPLVEELLAAGGRSRAEVRGWAIHPGGPRLVDVVGARLGLGQQQLATSRRVLAEHGNCSSPTVLMVLEELRRELTAGDVVVALTFGPGLTCCGALLACR